MSRNKQVDFTLLVTISEHNSTSISHAKKNARSISCHIPYDCFLFSTSSNGSDDGFLVLLEVLGELSAMEV
jgi:hypothetical protein